MHYEIAFTITIIIAVASIHSSDAFTCSCICCADNNCTQTSRVSFIVPTCESCKSVCEKKFSPKCIDMSGRASYECTSGNVISSRAAADNWFGTFRITEECDKSSCCCFDDYMHFSRTANNYLQIQGQFTGHCPMPRPFLVEKFPMPNGDSTQLRLMNQLVSIELSNNGHNMRFYEVDNPECRYKAERMAYTAVSNASLMTFNLVLVTLLSGLASF